MTVGGRLGQLGFGGRLDNTYVPLRAEGSSEAAARVAAALDGAPRPGRTGAAWRR